MWGVDSRGGPSAIKRPRSQDEEEDTTSELPPDHPKVWIPALCRKYYNEGAMAATAGSITSRLGNEIYIAPSGVQKEKIKADDLFIQTVDGVDIYIPRARNEHNKPKKSACTPLFLLAYKFKNANAVIHTHSINSVKVTMLFAGTEFRITHQEIIKAMIKCHSGTYYRYDEELVIPIIENAPREDLLEGAMHKAMDDYPMASAVLVRRHGVFVWGPSLEKAKIMYEALDYLFETAIFMKQCNIDPSLKPSVPHGAYVSTPHQVR
ncbi:putative methylthioribulose-1-phosphate dehydratase [Tubulanus polymorphus]|uniref:putative methylthioribulose-1-phosphate dehydratase n=1 Tax=Tubulanus polymorphus TaxID=672921 RepID=UPI003DA6629E